MVSSIYDPLGLVSPFILEGRQIVQKVCFGKLHWDEPVNKDVKQHWQNWMCKLKSLKNIKLNRCYKPAGFGKVVSCSLHYFSDASERGYGQVTYIRLVNKIGKIHCSLVMGKSRVTPMKYTSIPRLELAAAALSVKMAGIIKKEVAIDHISEHFWTDSQVVIGYIRNTQRRFKTFVANRVQQIREYSYITHWNYVSSKMNPADHASRGLSGTNSKHLDLWFNGPQFLWKSEFQWPKQAAVNIDDNDPEIKTEIKANTLVMEVGVLEKLEASISSWIKLVRVVAWIIKMKMLLIRIKKERSNIVGNEHQQGRLCLC